MQELIEDVASRIRARKQLARTIHFSFGYTEGGGVHKQYTLTDATNLERDIYKVVNYYESMCDKNALYRTLSVSLTQLINEEDRQLNLFIIDEYERRRDEKLAKTIDYFTKQIW